MYKKAAPVNEAAMQSFMVSSVLKVSVGSRSGPRPACKPAVWLPVELF